MACIAERLYDEDLRLEKKIVPKTREYKIYAKKYDELYTDFFEKMEPLQKTRFVELEETLNCVLAMEVKEAFVVGFQMGIQLLLDAQGVGRD